MNTYEIWSEGYCATGNQGQAYKHGEADGASFKEACQHFAKKNPEFAKCFDPEQLTYWGCSLFNNEQEARKTFG